MMCNQYQIMLQNKLFKKEKGKWFIIYEVEKADNKKYTQYDSTFPSCGFFPIFSKMSAINKYYFYNEIFLK